ncbi:hypothetical protein ACJRPK_16450 [Aquimarina sp. 2-A2]|uniref:hypothetical protein n=1 Tax=Aquimarina sp. 2-A2 TaxID=3382644 RepID=UPI00387F3788
MKAVTVKTLKVELNERSHHELVELCLRLSKFKKENKELLTYLLLEAQNEAGFIESVKEEITDQFLEINTKTFYFIKKSVRKILRMVKKYIRYSKNKETEVELLLYFCEQLSEFSPSIKRNITLLNLYRRELASIEKKIQALHEDLQYDYKQELDELTNF